MKSFFALFNKIVPEKFFLSTAAVFGLLFLFVTPPFLVPDEPNHFFKAWQVSDGVFTSVKQDQRVGGYLPSSLHNFVTPYARIIWSLERKFTDVSFTELSSLSAEGEKRFYDFNNTALYSPVCYLPQALGIFIAKLCGANLMTIFYAGRLMSFLTWLCIVFYAIKIIPVFRWLFTLLALLPMSLVTNMSLSADLMTNALCFLFVASVLKLAFLNGSISNRQLFFLMVLVVLLSSVKIVYVPLLLLIFILPKNKFQSFTHYVLWMGVLLLTSSAVTLFWSELISDLYIPYDAYNKTYRDSAALALEANVYKQLKFLKGDFTRTFSVLLQSIKDCSVSHIQGYIGLFGWLDTPLPAWMIYSLYALIYLVAAGDKEPALSLKWKNRFLFFGVFLLVLSLMFLSQYLSWIYVGAPSVKHIQGRYLIPFYGLFFMVFYGIFPGKKIIIPLVVLGSIICLGYTCVVLYSRYVAGIL